MSKSKSGPAAGCLTLGGVVLAAAAIAAPTTVAAQTSGDTAQIEEVVVTARKREERLQDTPVAVTALSSEALAARGVDSVDQIAKFAPSIRFDGAAALSGGNYNATVFIRG